MQSECRSGQRKMWKLPYLPKLGEFFWKVRDFFNQSAQSARFEKIKVVIIGIS